MYCRNCGKSLENDAVFCPFCGTNMSDPTHIAIQDQDKSEGIIKGTYSITPIRPWVRYFARMFDIYAYTIIGTFTSALVIGILLSVTDARLYGIFYNFILEHETIYSYIVLVSYIFVEPLLLSTTGTTLGKFIFKSKVKSIYGRKLTYKEAFDRSTRVFLVGLGLGIPFIGLITLLNSHSILKNTNTTSWDKAANSVVLHAKQSPARIIFGFILIIVLYLLILTLLGK